MKHLSWMSSLIINNQREANVHNGDIGTESESDDPDIIHSSQTPVDPALKKVIEKKREHPSNSKDNEQRRSKL